MDESTYDGTIENGGVGPEERGSGERGGGRRRVDGVEPGMNSPLRKEVIGRMRQRRKG